MQKYDISYDDEMTFSKFINDSSKETIIQFFMDYLPKGCLLHAHFSAMVDAKLFLNTLLHHETFYIYRLASGSDDSEVKIDSLTFKTGDLTAFEQFIDINNIPGGKRWIKMTKNNVDKFAENISNCTDWESLERITRNTWSIIKRKGIFEIYFELLLKECKKDYIDHIDLKGNIGSYHTVTYDNKGTFKVKWLGEKKEIEILKNIAKRYKTTFSLIAGKPRSIPKQSLANWGTNLFLILQKKNKDIIRGVDFFGEETKKGQITNCDLEELIKTISNELKDDKDFVFSIHGGENNKYYRKKSFWKSDPNIRCLLSNEFNSHRIRIGHGISILKYPELMKKIQQNTSKYHIELCPLSNKILNYIDDIRHHPGQYFHRHGLSVSINSDDPSMFGYNYVSHDWYEAITNWKLSLEDIKKIIINSIKFSATSSKRRTTMLNEYNDKFAKFIKHLKHYKKPLLIRSKTAGKKIRKHQGIIQTGGNRGKLKKGYRYSGKKLKNGLAQIIKCKFEC